MKLSADTEAYAETGHDTRCEQRPGGAYHGRTVRFTNPPMPIPCHCAARAQGRSEARRDLRNGR